MEMWSNTTVYLTPRKMDYQHEFEFQPTPTTQHLTKQTTTTNNKSQQHTKKPCPGWGGRAWPWTHTQSDNLDAAATVAIAPYHIVHRTSPIMRVPTGRAGYQNATRHIN